MSLWVRNLPVPNTVVVSLLGQKEDGTSEWSFYSFYPRESFKEWLARRHPGVSLAIIEHPTTDHVKIPEGVLTAIAQDVDAQLADGRTVVVIDSGGETRTGQVMRHMGFVEDTRAV